MTLESANNKGDEASRIDGVVDGTEDTIEDPQFPGGRQTALELALALVNTTKSSMRVFLLS